MQKIILMDGTALWNSLQSKTLGHAVLRSFLPCLQVVRYEYHTRQYTALSLLSSLLYLKTVASLLATLYKSHQRTAF